jgi:hypothetical protein
MMVPRVIPQNEAQVIKIPPNEISKESVTFQIEDKLINEVIIGVLISSPSGHKYGMLLFSFISGNDIYRVMLG